MLRDMFSTHLQVKLDEEGDVQRMCTPVSFAVAAGKRSVATAELGKFPTVRWATSGVRHVAVIAWRPIMQWLQAEGVCRESHHSCFRKRSLVSSHMIAQGKSV